MLEEGKEVNEEYKRQGLVSVSYEDLRRVQGRSERRDTLHYEDECVWVAVARKGKLRWSGVEARKKIRHCNEEKELDIFGLRKSRSGGELVTIGECQLKTSKGVSRSEMNELVEKMALDLFIERHGRSRKVEAAFFSNVSYDTDAKEFAETHGICTFRACPPKNWKKNVGWRLGPIEEV